MNCQKHGFYPNRFKSCPVCAAPEDLPASTPAKRLTTEEHIARMSDNEVRYIWNTVWWEQGTQETRALCLAEYDKRVGLDNWPAHIGKE